MDDGKQSVKEQFSKNAEAYLESESHAKGDDLLQILDWVQPQGDWMVLDIATGGGHVAKTVAPYVKRIFATDLTYRMLEITRHHLATEHPNMDFILADAESLPFLANSFHLVTCRIAPHHFPNPAKFIKEVARVLKQNGRFVLIDNVAPEDPELADYLNSFEKLRDKSHARCLSIPEWRELLTGEGLHEVKSQPKKKKQNYHVWLERMVSDKQEAVKIGDYMKSGSLTQKEYFQVKMEGNEIGSFVIDEWMVLCEKS